MKINANIDSGNIKVLTADVEKGHATLNINADSNSEFKQWFHFSLNGELNNSYSFEITNAADCSYEEGWQDYQVVASYDGESWFRITTEYSADKTLKFSHTLINNSIQFAYFAPYSYARHLDLIHAAQSFESVEHLVLGETVDGRNIDLLQFGSKSESKKSIWITARQHPGETMAQWSAEGLIERLLDSADPISNELLKKATIYVVPNMNVDGSIRGNLRSNAAGANLNREWLEPSVETSPEVYFVRQKMQQTGVDAYLDLHGDEALPYVFVAASEGNPSYNETIKNLEDSFSKVLKLVNPDFQTEYGYPKDEPGQSNLTIASNWVGETFNCLALTLEMPFKDNANAPDLDAGWSAERSKVLGEDLLTPLLNTINQLG